MKKLSFFLMAMLFSVMSFAATETISCPAGTVVSSKITMDFKSLTFLQEQGSSTSAVKAYSPWRIYKNHKVTFTPQTDVTIENLVITCTGSDYAKNGTLTNATATLSGTTLTITPTDGTQAFTFAATEAQVRWQKIVVTYKVAGEVVAVEAPKFDVTTSNFTEAFSLNITSAEGTTLKYTTDTTDPATSATAVVINTNTATVAIPAKSTMVRAIAIKGEDVSEEKETTYCYVNSPATAYTVAEAMEVIDAGLGLTNELYVKGEISTIEKYEANYGSITYWIKDEEGNKFECYSGLGLNKAKFTSVEDIEVGAYVVACGIMKKYNTTYEFNYNNYLVEYTAPAVTKYTVTVSANPAEAGTVAGGGEYEQGDTATLNATAAEGYEFTCWTEGTDTVATTAEYAFEVLANRNLVANFEEADQEPTYDPMDLTVTNLVMVDDPVFALTGSATIQNPDDLTLSLVVDVTAPNEDGTYNLTNASELKLGSSLMTFISGMALIDMMSNTATAQVKVQFEGMYFQLTINMSAKATATDVVVENATAVVEERELGFGNEVYYVLKMTSTWSNGETTYPVSLETAEFDPSQKSQEVDANVTIGGMGDDDPWLGSADGKVTITIVDTLATVVGLLENPYAFPAPIAFNLTISGILPKTIYYELNGGELPTVAVPTNAELWGTDTADVNGFMNYYNHYYNLKRATQTIENVATFAPAKMQQIMTDETSEYKWLGDYVQSVATAAGVPLSTDMAAANESGWRWSVWAFFNACAGKNGSAGIDFTEAGKPEVWGAAYQAAKGIVLPTEPVAEAYTLPTPTKEGSVFQGWYDNAEGQGEAMTVIPAGWYGTLYAIWTVEGGATTGLDNVPVVMDVVKVIKNGQLVIIRNGVEYNANGAILK